MLFPSTACIIQGRLGATRAAAFDISAACTGFIYGLQLAKQAIESGSWQHVLVIGAETLSRIMDWQDRNTCVLFGDGAGAAVVSRSADPKGRHSRGYGNGLSYKQAQPVTGRLSLSRHAHGGSEVGEGEDVGVGRRGTGRS